MQPASRSPWRALALATVASLAAAPSPARAQSQQFQHRWGGWVVDSFVLEEGSTLKQWLCEDRRVRYRTGTGSSATWTYQEIPGYVKGIVRRIHFLPTNSSSQQIGWAVTSDGFVIKTLDGGATWGDPGTSGPTQIADDLYDVHFLTETDGWLVGLHDVHYSVDGGESWDPVYIDNQGYQYYAELYAIDVVERSNGERIGLVCGEPGVVLRAFAAGSSDPNYLLTDWELVAFTRDMCPNGLGNLDPAGTLTCCQTKHCYSFTNPDPIPCARWAPAWTRCRPRRSSRPSPSTPTVTSGQGVPAALCTSGRHWARPGRR